MSKLLCENQQSLRAIRLNPNVTVPLQGLDVQEDELVSE
jgi:hypothetical protein